MMGIGVAEAICIGVALLILFGTALAVAVVLVARKGHDETPKP